MERNRKRLADRAFVWRNTSIDRRSGAILALLAIPFLGGCAEAMDADLVIRGGTVIDGTESPPRLADIFVQGDRIVLVGPPGTRSTSDAREVDASGRYVIPGLVDGHVHFSRGAPLPRRPDETDLVLRRLVEYGVTSILQMGATGGGVDSIRMLRTQASGAQPWPTIYGSGGHLTVLGSHPIYTLFPPPIRAAVDSMALVTPTSEPLDLDGFGIGLSVVRGPEAVSKAVERRASGGMDFVKITIESGPTPFGDNHPQMSLEMTRQVVEEAADRGLPVVAHTTSLDELEVALLGGAAGSVHAVRNLPLPDSAMAAQMAGRGFFVMPTLVLYSEPDLSDPYLLRTVQEEELAALSSPRFLDRFGRLRCCAPLAQVLENVGMLHRAGVPILLGTDTGNPLVFPGYSVHDELRLLVAAGLSPGAALQAATTRIAELIGQLDEFGTLEAGKRADLLILRGDPLADISNTRTVETVVLRGHVLGSP